MKESYEKLLLGNKKFALKKTLDDPDYFKKLSIGQKPEYLWIGCSDSRVPANEITNTESGEIFVHRNIANLVVHTDLNLLSVVEYAVNVLKVNHIIVCGHYGCGGVRAAMTNEDNGLVDIWLRNIKEVYYKYQLELETETDLDKRADLLCEFNVIEQVRNLEKTTTIQKAWLNRRLDIHGWIYGMNNGLIKELKVLHDVNEDLPAIFRYQIKK